MSTLKALVMRKPESEALADRAKEGFAAIDSLLAERDALANENAEQFKVIERQTMEIESLRAANLELQGQRDFWMQKLSRFESLLNQLGTTMQAMYRESQNGPVKTAEVQQLAQRFAPEAKDGKSVG